MGFPACLPLASYVLFFAIAYRTGAGRRGAAIHAALLWAVAATAITETLGLFHALALPGLAGAWMLAGLAAAGYLWRFTAPRQPLRALFRGMLSSLGDLEIALLSGILFLLAGVAAAALFSPPNTTDAMVYHMPRIVHWLHNRSVSFYATPELRQLKMPPWAQYAMLQFHGLSGGDRFDGLVQWFSFAGSVAGVSLIAGLLGAGMRGQMLAAVVCATIPQGLLEASGAANDCVAAFWLVALVYYLLRFGRDPSAGNACGIGGALGLACLTKTIAFMLAPPLVASLALLQPGQTQQAGQTPTPGQPRSKGLWILRAELIRGLAVAALLALALNTPHFARNYRLFHSLLGPSAEAPPAGFQYTNGRFGVGPTLSNVLRNLALHATTPLGPLNRAVETGVIRVLGAVGQNPNDPRTTWDYTAFHVPPLNLHEATAGNPLHAALILLVCGLLLWRWKAIENRPALWLSMSLSMGLAAAFLLFCAVLKWSPWHTRPHLPLFTLWAAVVGTVLARYGPRRATAALGMLLLLSATPEVFANQLRPFLGARWNIFNTPRQELYFTDLDDLLASYRDAVKFVESSHCPEIGLDLAQSGNEYPLYALLNDLAGSRPIRNVYVTNESRVYAAAAANAANDLRPAACVICPGCALSRPGWPALARQYRSVKQFGTVAVLSEPASANAAVNACTAEFSGWYALEEAGEDRWRWSSGKGVIHVKAAQALPADLEAVVLSARYPNEVAVLVNGERKALLRETSAEPSQLVWVPVQLQQGDNILEFLSGNPPVQLPPDPRWLALALRNLAFRTSGATACAVDHPH